MSSYSGLSEQHRAEARRVILHGADLFLRNPDAIHYTQDATLRWEGIHNHLRVMSGDVPTHGDCSSTHTFLLWNALTQVHPSVADIVNGEQWLAGFTGTLAQHGKTIHDIRWAKVGDAILYGPAPTYEHVATYLGGGRVFSHGGEAGPFKLGVDYRPDRGLIKRYI